MEELQSTTIDVNLDHRIVRCTLKEHDYGDYFVYDVWEGDRYLFTLSKDGDVLFNEPELSGQDEIMDPRELNELVERLREKMGDIG
jgi:hypothetical protein